MTHSMRLMALDEKAAAERKQRERRPARMRGANRVNKRTRTDWDNDKSLFVSAQEARAARPYIFGEED